MPRSKSVDNPTNHLSQGEGPFRLTEYKHVNKPHPLGIRKNFKPNQQPIHGGEFQDKTTQSNHGKNETNYRTDYHAHPLERPFVHKPDQYVKPQGDMDNMTSYKQEYVEKHAPPAKAIRNDGQRMIPAKFEGEPTYRSDYKKWDGSRPQPYGMQTAWEPPKSKFEGQTTFQTDYRSKELAPRQSFKPTDAAKMSDTPFEDRTSHRDAYIQHAMPARYQREREQYRPTEAQFNGLSTFRRDYKGALGEPTASFKPAGQAFQSEALFEDSTTNRHDFKKWPMERPFVHTHEPYKKPAGEMEMSTTHKSTYKAMPIDRVVARRPVSAPQSSAPLDGTTNYNSDYKKWNGERAQMPRQPDYVPNNAPFEGNSTYTGHYVPHKVQPAHSFRPDNNGFRSDAQFDDHTMYRQDYTAKPLEENVLIFSLDEHLFVDEST
ncbi:stabilizer of axonemal microtubules 2-like [Dreissena polymorpha]|uniref:stabilizer of axonemal microtubules 2-like n=1 Tax=Dreissena polymorpha TaxID=45954 RepID=UPI00226410D1|nr:stabilizer of axonemal microtubules 2-like [Dreissena polymorpha]